MADEGHASGLYRKLSCGFCIGSVGETICSSTTYGHVLIPNPLQVWSRCICPVVVGLLSGLGLLVTFPHLGASGFDALVVRPNWAGSARSVD